MPHHHSSEEHGDSHEHHGHHGHGFWHGCSERFWGDDKHEHEAKKIAFISIIILVIAFITIVTVIVVCCKRKRKAKEACRRKQQIKNAVVTADPAAHPKAVEAYGPGGVPPSMVVVVPTDAPPYKEASEGENKDPRLALGVFSPPPAYEEPK